MYKHVRYSLNTQLNELSEFDICRNQMKQPMFLLRNLMSFLFKRETPAEMLRKHQRALQKAIRDLDRERQKLEQQEKKVIADIKKAARAGQNNACKIMAKDLVRTRRYVQKFYAMRTQLQGVSLRIQVCFCGCIFNRRIV